MRAHGLRNFGILMIVFGAVVLAGSFVMELIGVGANWVATWTMAGGGLSIGFLALARWLLQDSRTQTSPGRSDESSGRQPHSRPGQQQHDKWHRQLADG